MAKEQRASSSSVSMRRAAVLTGCLVAIALLAVAYWAKELRLPDPDKADRAGLIRWLVMRDLRDEPAEIRAALLKRLQDEVTRDFDPAEVQSQIDERYRERIWANTLTLMETWYQEKVDRYLAAPAPDRIVRLDETIAEMERCKNLAVLQPGFGSASPAEDASLNEVLQQHVAAWKEAASVQRRREITEFDAALRARWLMHTLGLVPHKPT